VSDLTAYERDRNNPFHSISFYRGIYMPKYQKSIAAAARQTESVCVSPIAKLLASAIHNAIGGSIGIHLIIACHVRQFLQSLQIVVETVLDLTNC
jgi:hypothetical protein